jgi:hypothetical protein
MSLKKQILKSLVNIFTKSRVAQVTSLLIYNSYKSVLKL